MPRPILGAGKSVLLALMAMQFRRDPGARIVMFDKGRSTRAAVLAMGGTHHTVGSTLSCEPELAFQPLQRIHAAGERSWAVEWLTGLLGAGWY